MHRKFGLLVIVVVILLLGNLELKAEAFYIRNYDVQIELNRNGSFNVVETIDLTFSESRRGILRDIPVRYREEGGRGEDRAIRPIGPELYEIVVEDIRVDDHPFTYFMEGDHMRIRIGDPDKRITGDQRYTISYTVWGAINEFRDHVEFSWNIIGHHWNTDIHNASFSIEAEEGLSFNQRDVVYATGRIGARQRDMNVNVEQNRISGELTQPLGRFEGISLATRHPKNQFTSIHTPIDKFATHFVVREHRYFADIGTGGYFEVRESMTVEFLEGRSSFSRIAGRAFSSPLTGLAIFPLPKNLSVESNDQLLDYELRRRGNDTYIRFFRTDQSEFSDEVSVSLTYDLWGGTTVGNNVDKVRLTPSGFYPQEPVENIRVELNAPFTGRVASSSGRVSLPDLFQRADESSLIANASYPAYRLDYLAMETDVEKGFYDEAMQPPGLFGKDFLVDRMHIRAEMDNRQGVELHYEWTVEHPFPGTAFTFEPVFLNRYSYNPEEFNGHLKIPSWNLMDGRIAPVTEFSTEKGDWQNRVWGSRRVLTAPEGVRAEMNWNPSATVLYRGLFRSENGRSVVEVPVVSKTTEPIRNIEVELIPPDGFDRSDISAELLIDQNETLTLNLREGIFVSDQPDLVIPPGSSMTLKVSGHEGFAGDLPIGSALYLIFRNNFPIWWLLLLVLVLYLLWDRFGRNRKEAVVVQFYPPQKITSAEAGLLWDDKLHKKDLVSLIYYWAGKGYLEVEEIQENKKMSYKLRKKKDLPASARGFERTFFNGIFFRDEVKLSELRSRFSRTMMRAYKELMLYSKQHDFYAPGSRGFGCGLIGLGILSMVAGIVGLVFAFFTGHWSWGVSPLLAGFVLVFFGRIMPKKGPFGMKKYQKLLGFREFVRTAEIDRIKALYRENPGYFDSTIAYAIVFGLGKQWAEKFEGIMTEPPDWYKGRDRRSTFSTIVFTDALVRSMHRMNYDLSMPPPSSSGSGASSWSGGGGSGFGGGGFSSGGGFGGGGGSSW